MSENESEGSSFEANTLSFGKIYNPPFLGTGAETKSILSNGIHATQLSDNARPLQDWETNQRILERELDDELWKALEHENSLVPQAALSAAETIGKQSSKENISRETEKSHDLTQIELQSQDCRDWGEIFEFCVW